MEFYSDMDVQFALVSEMRHLRRPQQQLQPGADAGVGVAAEVGAIVDDLGAGVVDVVVAG